MGKASAPAPAVDDTNQTVLYASSLVGIPAVREDDVRRADIERSTDNLDTEVGRGRIAGVKVIALVLRSWGFKRGYIGCILMMGDFEDVCAGRSILGASRFRSAPPERLISDSRLICAGTICLA